MTGRLVAQSICDWIVRYTKFLESSGEYDDSTVNTFYSFAAVLQTTINDGAYDV